VDKLLIERNEDENNLYTAGAQSYEDDCFKNELYKQALDDIEKLKSLKKVITSELQKRDDEVDSNIDNGNTKQYTVDNTKTKAIYDFCIKTDVISEIIKYSDFLKDVENASFENTFNNTKKKTKFRYIIYILSQHIENRDWYKDAAKSIGLKPENCSGARVPKYPNKWKSNADALK